MDKTLTYFNNLQYDPIEIGDFCIVEVYQNSVAPSNALGYYIQPLSNITNPEATIRQRVRAARVSQLDGLVILPGREMEQYSHKIVYAVFYNSASTPPTYPLLPEQVDLGEPADQLDIYESFEIENEGTPTDCIITLSLSSLAKDVEFYINDRKYLINVAELPPAQEKILIIDRNGVKYNSMPTDKFKFSMPPQLMHGKNIIKVDKMTVADIEIKYLRKY